MNLQRLTNWMQGLCHDGHSQLEVTVLDADMHEHLIKDIKLSPNGRIWINLYGQFKVCGGKNAEKQDRH